MKRLLIFICLFTILVSGLALAQEKKAPMKPALLVIDVQNKFVPMMSAQDQEQAFQYINYAIWMFRQHKLPVIRVYHTDPQWGPATDSEEFAFKAEVQVTEEDPQVIKNFPNAFKKTDLKKILDEMNCNTVFLCGLSSTGCVLATYYGAHDLDYKVFMIKNALLGPEASHTEAVEEFTDAVGMTVLQALLENCH